MIPRELVKSVGQRVVCTLDNPDREEAGTLLSLRANGPRVQLDSGRTRTVAAWRLRREDD